MADGRALVLGATGFLGAATVAALEAAGRDVVASSRAGAGHRRCDVADPGELSSLLDDVRPESIVNCAVVPDFGEGALARMYAVNALAPGVLAGWCAREGAHLVQASATLVHGSRTGAVDASTPIAVDTDCGATKLLAEDLIAASGCDAAVLRFCGIYGAGGPSHLGLNTAIDGALRGTPPTLRGPGGARRNYIHVADAAAVAVHALDRRLTGVRLAAGPEVLSIAEMLQVVCDVLLPGSAPECLPGGDGADQIVEHAPDLPPGRPMADAIRAR